MARHPTLTCSDCGHTAAVHLCPPGRNGRVPIRRCPACSLIIPRDGRPANDAREGYQHIQTHIHTLIVPADQREAARLKGIPCPT